MPELKFDQHIHWQAWNAASRQRAREEDKIIVVFCASTLDHWSQRWLREIHAASDLCASINELCVPVFIDVDKDIDVAARAQEVLSVTSNASGWPAIMWLTPDGHPIGASPYRPIFDGEQMRGLAPMFIEIMEAWLQQRAAVEADVRDMRGAWRYIDTILEADKIIPLQRCADQLEAHIMNSADSLEGGFGPAPRPFYPAWLGFLLRRMRSADAAPSLKAQLEKTLRAMLAGGVYDHLYGGFFRAATDSSWNIPFFEKRALEQIQLIEVLCLAADVCDEAVYADAAQQCYDFLIHALRLENGACARGLAAESIGADGQLINGAAYLWSYRQLEDILGKSGAQIIQKRFIADERCFIDEEFACLAIRDEITADEREQLPALCQRLAQARRERPQPQRDACICPYIQATLLRLHSLPVVQRLALDPEWPQQLCTVLLNLELNDSRSIAAAALAVQQWQQHNNSTTHAAWVEAQAVRLQELQRANGSMLLSAATAFADPPVAAADTAEYLSPLADVYRLWSALPEYREAAGNILQLSAKLISAAPLAHASLLCAYYDCK